MNMKKIIITIERQWTTHNIVNGITPAEKLAKQLAEVLPSGTKVNEEGFTCVTILVDADVISEETVVAMVSKAFFMLYTDANKDVLSVTVERGEQSSTDELLTSPTMGGGVSTEAPIKDESLTSSSNGGNSFGFGGESEGLFLSDGPENGSSVGVIDEIDGLIAADDLKALAHEIVSIAPMIIKNKTYDVFTNQSYIFSINDGYGISTYVTLLAELIGQTKLKKISTRLPSVEIKLGVMDDRDPFTNPHGPFASILSFLGDERVTDCVVCIDISEWMSALEGEHFRKLLKILDSRMDNYVYVFRIPYVEPDVLERVQLALNDLMFVHPLTFPPLSREELQLAAEKEIKKYGFEIAEGAWECFHNRITSFYCQFFVSHLIFS